MIFSNENEINYVDKNNSSSCKITYESRIFKYKKKHFFPYRRCDNKTYVIQLSFEKKNNIIN